MRRLLEEVEVISPLHPSRPREVTLVRLGDESFVLKSKAPPKQWMRQGLLRLLGHPEIVNEVVVYRALSERQHTAFRVPRLIATDGRSFLLLEYVNGRPARLEEMAQVRRVAEALVSFQQMGLFHGRRQLSIRQPRGLVFSFYRFAARLHSVLPRRTLAGCARLLLRLRAEQPVLQHLFTVHNDLNPGNVLIDGDGQVVLLDFAAVTSTRRWLYQDIVMLASGGKDDPSSLRPGLVAAYTEALMASDAAADIRPDAQLRAALLVKTMHRILFRHARKRAYESAVDFLESDLLNDNGYGDWYRAFSEAGNRRLAQG